MESITLGQCFRGAWRDAGHAALSRPFVFLAVFALLFTLSYLSIEAHMAVRAAAHSGAGLAVAVHGAGKSLASAFGQWLLMSVIAVQVMRFSLLGSDRSGRLGLFDSGFFRYLGLSAALGVVIVVAALVIGVGVSALLHLSGASGSSVKAALATLIVLTGCAVSYLYTRVSLSFCDAAVRGHAPYRVSWRATRGHYWAIAGAHIATLLPYLVIAVPIGLVVNIAARATLGENAAWAAAIIQTLSTMIWGASAAACSAWLYRRFGETLKPFADTGR
jgi:hypothetical protein